jgi:hypothetical protein
LLFRAMYGLRAVLPSAPCGPARTDPWLTMRTPTQLLALRGLSLGNECAVNRFTCLASLRGSPPHTDMPTESRPQ